jgi:hypothetical protein
MTKRPSFDKNYLKEEFDRLNAKTKQPLTLFLRQIQLHELKKASNTEQNNCVPEKITRTYRKGALNSCRRPLFCRGGTTTAPPFSV